jgi:hypothetical protein
MDRAADEIVRLCLPLVMRLRGKSHIMDWIIFETLGGLAVEWVEARDAGSEPDHAQWLGNRAKRTVRAEIARGTHAFVNWCVRVRSERISATSSRIGHRHRPRFGFNEGLMIRTVEARSFSDASVRLAQESHRDSPAETGAVRFTRESLSWLPRQITSRFARVNARWHPGRNWSGRRTRTSEWKFRCISEGNREHPARGICSRAT